MKYRYCILFTFFVSAIVTGCSMNSMNSYFLDQPRPDQAAMQTSAGCETCHTTAGTKQTATAKPHRYYPIRISHKQHVALGIDCTFCHRMAVTSTSAADYLMPQKHADATQADAYSLQAQPSDGNACKACHIHYSDYEKNNAKIPARCDTCHVEYTSGKELPYLKAPQRYGLSNNHKIHVDNNIPCLRCHKGIELTEKSGVQPLPNMKICMECHDLPVETMRKMGQQTDVDKPEWLARAERLYGINCAPCHGTAGRGDGPVSAYFTADLKPRDHTDSEYMGKKSDEDLFLATWRGGAEVNRSIRMPSFEGLITEKDAQLLIFYLRWLSLTPPTPPLLPDSPAQTP